MDSKQNFFQRALHAIVEGRTREAERYVARFQRDHGRNDGTVKQR